jgi:hypothetical protein
VANNPSLGDTLQGTKDFPFLAKDRYTFLNAVPEQGLAELKSGNIAVQKDLPGQKG